MPDFTITISQKAVDCLKAVVDRYNQDNGTDYTVKQWLVLTVKNVAIATEFAASISGIQQVEEQEAKESLQAALETKRQELLSALG